MREVYFKFLFTIALCCGGMFAMAQPANDGPCGAIAVTCGDAVAGTTVGATATTTDFCGTTISAPGVFYKFEGNGNSITFSTCNTASYDTKISAYTGGCEAPLVCIGGNDDFAGCAGFTSELTVATDAGTDYLIYVSGFGSATGTFTLSVSGDCSVVGDTYDDCEGAIEIGCDETVSGSTTGANTDGMPFCGTSNTAPGVWYSFTPDTDGVKIASTCSGTSYDSKISVFTGACGSLSLSCIDGNDDDCGLQSSVDWDATAGETYFILVHGFGTASGDFDLTLECLAPVANDGPCSAEALTLGVSSAFNNITATADAGEVSPGPGTGESSCNSQDGWCSFEVDVDNSIWYTFEAPASGAVSVEANDFDLQIAVWTADDCLDYASFTEIGGNDDSGPGLSPYLELYCLTPGATYYVQVDGYNGATGEGTVTATELADVLPTVSISQGPLPDFCQGGTIVLTANSNVDADYLWSTGEETESIQISADGEYTVTVTSENGCTATATAAIVDFNAGSLISAYTIIATEKDVHLHGDNVVNTGGVGAMDDKGKIKLHENTHVLTFSQADKVDINDGSSSAVVNLEPADVILPPFLSNPYDSDNDVKVEDGETVVLTDCIYDKLEIKKNATVTFTCADVYIHELKIKDNVTILFDVDANMYIDKHLHLGKNCNFNPTGKYVTVYADDHIHVKEGSDVIANFYSTDDIKAEGDDDKPTTMTGLFIGEKVDGKDYVTWNWNPYCSALPEPPPCVNLSVSLTTDNFANETTWELYDDEGDLMASGGGFDNATTYTLFDDCVAPGCYEFVIYDSFGDGICCSFGTGSYSVTYDGVTTPSPTGGDFGSSESLSVGDCVAPRIADVVIQEAQEVRFEANIETKAYPNPFQDQVRMEFNLPEDGRTTLQIISITGQVVHEADLGMLDANIRHTYDYVPQGQLNNGTYIYRIVSGDLVSTGQLIMMK